MCHLDKLLHFIRVMSLNVAGTSLRLIRDMHRLVSAVSKCCILWYCMCELNPKPFKICPSTTTEIEETDKRAKFVV